MPRVVSVPSPSWPRSLEPQHRISLTPWSGRTRTRHPGRATRTHGLRRLEWERPRTERHSFRTRPTELCRAGRSDSRPSRERRPPARRHTRRCGYAIRGTCRPPVLSIDPAHVIGADAHRRPGEAAGDLHRTERVQLRSITELSEGVVAVRRPKANKHGLVDMSPPRRHAAASGGDALRYPIRFAAIHTAKPAAGLQSRGSESDRGWGYRRPKKLPRL